MISILTKEILEKHIDQFINIAADIPLESWNKENYLFQLPGKWDYSLVFFDNSGEKILGFIIASDKSSSIHIHKFAVHPDFRSQKLGLKLLKEFEKHVKQKSACRIISLYVDAENEKAINFYSRNGFEFVERVESMNFYNKKLEYIVAIHQPNLFPWLGFFHKMSVCDHFIILDHVTNNPVESIYTKRVTIVCNNQPFWLTVPLAKPKGETYIPINAMEIATDNKFVVKQLKTIELSYKKTPFYNDFFYLFENFYQHKSKSISARNLDFILEIKRITGLTSLISLSSSYGVSTANNQLLVDLTKAVNGNVYLHGSFAVSDKGYQDQEIFSTNNIKLEPQKFSHPVYLQMNNKGEFIPGTSIIDALFNIGAIETSAFFN